MLVRAPDLKRLGKEFRRVGAPVDEAWPGVLDRMAVTLGPWRITVRDLANRLYGEPSTVQYRTVQVQLDRLVKKHKEKLTDHHAAEVARRRG